MAKEIGKEVAEDAGQLTQNLQKQVSNLSNTPYPAWVFASLLLFKGISHQKPIESISGSSGGSYQFAKSLAGSKPSRASCFTFGLTHLLGGWIIFDGDVLNGAGFNFAWSSLYLIVNGTSSIKSIAGGRVSPLGLSLLALGNAGIYGKKFFWPSDVSNGI
ncbi:hypothetical protein HYPBUDRAFT_166954 [Hyphopichia burtonii NRRL Y-1933]|uniref:Uncharacterized protein n=1 Tax=Hyphopichia burtonii NRRL Y-1933 TaxID=984485 RepID=A0A1E4RIF7_9ASCO|nr:hypothetical protein HYPBUDRAFT_166954 [Hyphopichia burtonii NRRL Y-1933]ODV67054.1 hypothetical protein HYPBUDRAFT_166954 [Hyphopichia burtonii NRRL Y-1933]